MPKLSARENLVTSVKFFLFSVSAGVIETVSFALLSEFVFHDAGSDGSPVYGWSYFIALALSVLWNFTLNRRYTFKSANNVPVAMLKVFAFYCVFTPASIWWGVALTGLAPGSRLVYYGVFAGTLAANFITEFLYQRFFVFGKSMNTNSLAQKGELKIETERLLIRPFTRGDLNDLAALIRDKMASEYAFSDTQWQTGDADIENILVYYMGEKPWSWCAVELKAAGRVIGFACAGSTGNKKTRNLGYTIHSDHQNKGYAYEACHALMEHCQSALGTRHFSAGTADCNTPSVKLLDKLGFVKIRSFEASFAKDAQGNPISFAAGEYEYKGKKST